MPQEEFESKDKVTYPADFVERVRKCFSGHKYILEMLEAGSPMLGGYLDEGRRLRIDPIRIVNLFEKGRQDAILRVAKKAAEIEQLYQRWLELEEERL